MIDWESHALRMIREHRERPILIWTPLTLVAASGLPYTPRNRRGARKALEALWKRGLVLRRREAHGIRETPNSPYAREVAYSLPGLVQEVRTTPAAVYEPEKGRALTDDRSAPP